MAILSRLTDRKLLVLLPSSAVVMALLWGMDAAPVHPPYLSPGCGHVLGTDNAGRDVLRLTLQAAGTSLTIGLAAALGATMIGALIGCVAGYLRGGVDDILMRLTDVFLLIPMLPLVIVLTTYLGPGTFNVIMLIMLTAWPSTARVMRARVLSLREKAYIVNAKSMGAGTFYLVRRHILPNCSEVLLAKASLAVAAGLLTEAGVSFLSLGDSHYPSWGSMLHDAFAGAALINGAWWWFLPPLVCIAGSVILFHLIGHRLMHHTLLLHFTPANLCTTTGFCGSEGARDAEETGWLTVEGLNITFVTPDANHTTVIKELDLTLSEKENVTIVGATGSGKSLLLLTLMGLLPVNARISGRVWFQGNDLTAMAEAEWRRLRGRSIGYIPQSVGEALNPMLTIGTQLVERIRVHSSADHETARLEAVARLSALRFDDPATIIHCHPHHLSGGMKQRVLIAQATAGNPPLLLADEPTKGLDTAAVEDTIHFFQSLTSASVLAVTHDLRFARALGGKIIVLHNGKVVEQAPVDVFFDNPWHPYSAAFVGAQYGRLSNIGPLSFGNGQMASWPGCPFRTLCGQGDVRCDQPPPLYSRNGRLIRCWRYAT